MEEEVYLNKEHKAEGILREDNFKSLKTISRSRIYIENLVTGKFSRIRHELTEEEAVVENLDEKQANLTLEFDLFNEMEKWSNRTDNFQSMFANCVVGMAISQFIVFFVSANMSNWLTLNGRICLLWSQIISIFVQLALIFSLAALFIKWQKH